MGFEFSFQEAQKRFEAVVKEFNLKKIKTSPGPVAAMAALSPNGSRHLQRLGKDVQTKVTSLALDPCKAFFSVPESSRNLI
jgi:hypothetical protein